ESLGATVDIPPGLPSAASESIIKSFQKPTAALVANGTGAAASARSAYVREILVDSESRPLAIEEGQPFVSLEKGDSFQIRFTNKAADDVAVSFLLDGVSSYAFSEIRE